jgi:transglutaminase-like putative cysteine protease
MLFHVTHATRYEYAHPVFLEPHTFRLRPRCDGTQRVIRFQLQVHPAPRGLSEMLDADGNAVAEAWFEGVTGSLAVISTFDVETLRRNPFDYLPGPPAAVLPLEYPAELAERLRPYLAGAAPGSRVEGLARAAAEASGREAVAFLAELNRRIHGECRGVVREDGDPRDPEETLEIRAGACRDLAVLFMAACRAAGIASRFVTGYHLASPGGGRGDLHAWAEVYLPGGGWRGFDPSKGLAAADRHIAVAAGPAPRDAAPITGTFRGSAAGSSMSAEVEIHGIHATQ